MAGLQTEVLITVAGQETERIVLEPGDYVIGRNADCPIRVEADLVSRTHAKVILNDDHALIEDLGSSNGTQVNGRPIAERTRLWPNQKIQVGAATIELRRLKVEELNGTLAPIQALVRRVLPEESLREKKYDIGSVVARGGMGAILDAKEVAIERTVAMKVMLDGNSTGDLMRFLNEARITGQLEHPNIVPVHELSVDGDGRPYYTMKFVQGVTLRKVLELMAAGDEAALKKYPLAALLTTFQKVCDALSFAHSKGVIHRDLKPENLMLGDYGEVLVMDWGLAKTLGAARSATPEEWGVNGGPPSNAAGFDATMAGTVMGTPQFMSPEQARGEVDTLDARSDIYSLGAILYQILSLRVPVTGHDAWEMVGKAARGDIDPLITPTAKIPRSLAAVVHQAMALAPSSRYATVAALQRDIEAYQTGFATSAENADAWKHLTLFVQRNKAASLGLVAVFLVGGTLGAKALLEGRRAEREAATAKATLADLRRTAPVFHSQAKVDFNEGKFGAAIEKIGYAIQLDETGADYYLFRAHLRQSSEQLAQAGEDYRQVLALRPADTAARENLALCEKLLQETGGAALGRSQQRQLLAALRDQKRLVESAPLAALIDPDTATAKEALLVRLHELRGQPAWNDSRVIPRPDGSFHLNLVGLHLPDFSVLKGQPVGSMNLQAIGLTDLSGLAGLPLKELTLSSNKFTDLSPLRGAPLEVLDLMDVPISDLSPLRGMKLRKLKMQFSNVSDLSPLAGMPLIYLYFSHCPKLVDLSPLRGAPLEFLDLTSTPVSDLTPLAGMPLQHLDLDVTRVTDLTPLAQCVHLQELLLNVSPVTSISPLEKLQLTHLDCRGTRITDVTPLRGQPLRFLGLDLTRVTDLSPLTACPSLEELVLPETDCDPSVLRNAPRLRAISYRSVYLGLGGRHPAQTAEEFWKEYEEKRAAEKK